MAKDMSGQDVTALGVVKNSSGTFSIGLAALNLFNITATSNSQTIVHNFIDLPSKTKLTQSTESFPDKLIGTLSFLHDRTENLQKIGEPSSTTDPNAFLGFTVFDFDKPTDTFNKA